jgi:hypothetical protein
MPASVVVTGRWSLMAVLLLLPSWRWWVETVIEEDRAEGQHDPVKRLHELDREGVSGEVVFPDFGLPFDLHPPLVAAIVGYHRTPEQIEAANRAYNRWRVDF